MIDAEALRPFVEGWLPVQRWFGGKGRTASVAVTFLAALSAATHPVELWVADLRYDDDSTERYQLPLVVRSEPSESLDHVLVATVETSDGPMWIYDALHDKDVTGEWLVAMRDETSPDGLSCRRYVDPAELTLEETSVVQSGEQSNTSVTFGDRVIMKVYRRLQPGINPDIEVLQGLGEHEARHVAPLLGSIEYTDEAGSVWALAMAQEFLTTATDGWELAKISVRDLFNEADLHADEAGGDFAGEATRLGVAIAETHADLVAAFGVSTVGREDVARRAEGMRARLESALRTVGELSLFAEQLRAIYDDFEAQTDGLVLQRIHADLHLGQVLRTSHRWVVIDFEGEPMADIASRRLPDTPLRDVAGMLRSFEYAGHTRLVEIGADDQLAYRASEWSERNRAAFCEGYASVTGNDPRDQVAALRAYEADKAVYEAVYEARNRPAWLTIPLRSLSRLVLPAKNAEEQLR